MIKTALLLSAFTMTISSAAYAEHVNSVSDEVIAQQRENLANNMEGKGFGPQSPRDINSYIGNNPVKFRD